MRSRFRPRVKTPLEPRSRGGFGMFSRVLILLFFLVGVVLCFKLSMRIYHRSQGPRARPPRPSPSALASVPTVDSGPAVPPPADPSPSPAPDPDSGDDDSGESVAGPRPHADLAALRAVSDEAPEKAFEVVFSILVSSDDILLVDQATYELENRLENFDRDKVYLALDQVLARKSEVDEEIAGLFLEAMVCSQRFLHAKHDPARTEAAYRKVFEERDPVISPLALHRLATMKVIDDSRKSIALFQEQIQEFPDCPLNGQASFLIGTCYRVLEEDYKALEQCQLTLKEYPDSKGQGGDPLEPYVRHTLADIYIHIDRKEDARKELDYVKEFWKDYRYQGLIDELLKSLS